MKKKTIVALLVIVVLALSALWVLKRYQLDLIHAITVETVVEKSPERARPAVRRAFSDARHRANVEGKEDLYLKRLIRLSQQLEKVQRMDEARIRRLIQDVTRFDEPEKDS